MRILERVKVSDQNIVAAALRRDVPAQRAEHNFAAVEREVVDRIEEHDVRGVGRRVKNLDRWLGGWSQSLSELDRQEISIKI